ncbi:MAG: hypothetical protein RIS73_1604 [Bacteroidota bacterium]
MLAILVVLLAAAAVGYYVLNKKHFSVANTTAAAKITAVVLHQTFITDSSLAKNKFIGDETNQKVIQVEGEVSEIKKDQQDNTIILLKTATDGAFINSSMEGKTENIKVGSKIVIKGICTGYNFDAEMGIPGDVILTRCYLIK